PCRNNDVLLLWEHPFRTAGQLRQRDERLFETCNRAGRYLRFARTLGRLWESAGDLFIQVGWQVPQFEESSLYFGQGGEQGVNAPVDLHHADPDRLQGTQQQLGAGAGGAAPRLPGVEVLQLRPLLVQPVAHHPLQQRQQSQRQAQEVHQALDALPVREVDRRQPQRPPLQPRPVVLDAVLAPVRPHHRRQRQRLGIGRVDLPAHLLLVPADGRLVAPDRDGER